MKEKGRKDTVPVKAELKRESEAVVVSPRHSRAKSAVQVKSELSTKMHVYAIS